ncbi:MAG: hypothetical protein RL235_1083 [Chlamydiota bacterium]|jgi:hypothetical protein
MKSWIVKIVVLLPLLLAADEEVLRVPVAERQSEESVVTQDEMSEDEVVLGYLYDRYPPVYYPSSAHQVIAISVLGDSVEIEDGSVWKVHPYDNYKVVQWKSNDPLVVTQNHAWFSKYDYRLINNNTGATIEANLHLGPIQQGPYTKYIVSIDDLRNEVMLSDSTHWLISKKDRKRLKNWAIHDAVIVGTNSGSDGSSEALLINVNMNQRARAHQF